MDPLSHHAGFLGTAQLFVSLQTGRWSDAAQQSEQLLQQFARHDSFGITPLVAAARAFVLAVQGERADALAALRLAETPRWGIGQILGGVTRLFILRAQQWLREGDVGAAAADLAGWARREGLEMIELLALHASCYEQQGLSDACLERARDIAARVESSQAPGIIAHIERVCANRHQDASSEVRLLAELGIWLPLPPAADFSPREREVALFATLGHSSKFIAERLGVSTRTVETHLTHVFTKIGVQNRDELGLWFARRPVVLANAASSTHADAAARTRPRR